LIAVTVSVLERNAIRWMRWVRKHDPEVRIDYARNFPTNKGLVPRYQELYERFSSEDIIVFTHDDFEPHEPWASRIQSEFEDPKVVIVGLGGAVGIGVRGIYKTRYNIWQLQRIGYHSNQSDAETHGRRFTGAMDVAVVDGFFMALRTEFLKRIGGWSWFPFGFHCYDTSICLMAARHGYKVRMVGLSCTHHGASASTGPAYRNMLEAQGRTIEQDHAEPHVWMYREFNDVLPLMVEER
jgi:GT2 family glycosyltransferase